MGVMKELVATVGEDKKLKIWKLDFSAGVKGSQQNQWHLVFEKEMQCPVWKCSWSPLGFMLAVSSGDNETKVFKESNDGEWNVVEEISQDGQHKSQD